MAGRSNSAVVLDPIDTPYFSTCSSTDWHFDQLKQEGKLNDTLAEGEFVQLEEINVTTEVSLDRLPII